MQPQPRQRFVHPNAYPVHSMSSLGHIGAKSTRCPSPIGPRSVANNPTSSGNGAFFASDFSSATAAGSTHGARDGRGGKIAGGSLICTSRTAAERCFQQKHRLQYDRNNGSFVSKAEWPRELEGFEGFEGFPAVEHRVRNSGAPHDIRRSNAAPTAFGDHVPPHPPPMLSMEQQRRLKQMQRERQQQQRRHHHERYLQDRPVMVGVGQHHHQHQHQHHHRHHDGTVNGNHIGVEVSEGSGKGYTLLPSLLPSPSGSSLMPSLHQHQHLDHHHQHELQGLSTPRDQRVWQSTTAGHHHGDLPVPRFASIMPAAPSPHSATAMLQVPIFSSLSEALHHQREQQKRQAQAGQLQNDLSLHHLPHPANSLIHAQPSMGGGVCISNASCSTPRQMSDSAGAAHAMPNGQQPPRQGQRHRACGPLATVEQSRRNEQQQQQRDRGVGGGSFGSAGNGYGVDQLCSPGGLVASQMKPLRAPPGISVSMAAPVSGTSSASVSPVVMYAYPHGYVMAYPPLQVQTPRTPHSTASQVQVPQQQQYQQQAWNPYECVSPSGESCKGFGNTSRESSWKGEREKRDKREAPRLKTVNTVKTVEATASREDSPSLSSTLSSGDTLKDDLDADLSPDSKVEDDTAQGRKESRPRKSTATPRDAQPPEQDQEQAPSEASEVEGSNDQESVFKTPRRMREAVSINSNSRNTDGVPSEDDKENVYCNTNGGFDSKKAVGACDPLEEQLLGKKRGGDEIAKQKSFTGSYFQVSPTSFLQPSKRQRNTFSRE